MAMPLPRTASDGDPQAQAEAEDRGPLMSRSVRDLRRDPVGCSTAGKPAAT
jgi:hypothetical protein